MLRLQSAMEYLITYGWAVLAIGTVIGVLYYMGVFSSISFLPPSVCNAQQGFYCGSPKMTTSGLVNITFGQASQTMTVVGTACATNSTAPAVKTMTYNAPLAPGQQTALSFLCPIAKAAIGTPFSGRLWLFYNTQAQSGLEALVGTLTATATASPKILAQGGWEGSGGTDLTDGGAWTLVNSGAGAGSVESSVVHQGSYAAQFTANVVNVDMAAVSEWVAGQSTFGIRLYFFITSPMNSGEVTELLDANYGGESRIAIYSGGIWLRGLTKYDFGLPATISPGIWHCLEDDIYRNSTNGYEHIYLDGVELYSGTGNTRDYSAFNIRVGNRPAGSNYPTRTVYIDDVVVGNGYVGCIR